MNFHACRSAARVYFADEPSDDFGITKDGTKPSLLPSIPSLVKRTLTSLISLGKQSSMPEDAHHR